LEIFNFNVNKYQKNWKFNNFNSNLKNSRKMLIKNQGHVEKNVKKFRRITLSIKKKKTLTYKLLKYNQKIKYEVDS
jgi:hypothetical protein